MQTNSRFSELYRCRTHCGGAYIRQKALAECMKLIHYEVQVMSHCVHAIAVCAICLPSQFALWVTSKLLP